MVVAVVEVGKKPRGQILFLRREGCMIGHRKISRNKAVRKSFKHKNKIKKDNTPVISVSCQGIEIMTYQGSIITKWQQKEKEAKNRNGTRGEFLEKWFLEEEEVSGGCRWGGKGQRCGEGEQQGRHGLVVPH